MKQPSMTDFSAPASPNRKRQYPLLLPQPNPTPPYRIDAPLVMDFVLKQLQEDDREDAARLKALHLAWQAQSDDLEKL